jgi:hypothetical protein
LPRTKLRETVTGEHENVSLPAGEAPGVELVPAVFAAIVAKRLGGGGMQERAGAQVADSTALRTGCGPDRRNEALGKNALRRPEINRPRWGLRLEEGKRVIDVAAGKRKDS